MRNRKWDLIWGILALIICTVSLIKGTETTKLFGFEINSWIYRGLWLLIAVTNLVQFFTRRKKEVNQGK